MKTVIDESRDTIDEASEESFPASDAPAWIVPGNRELAPFLPTSHEKGNHDQEAPMTKKILFATDFSQASQHALFFATSLARDNGATLLITHVVETEGPVRSDFLDEDAGPSEAQLNELHGVVPTGVTISCEYRLLHGNPAAKIVELAEKEDAEAIVMGTCGHSRMGHLLAGSVAKAVMREAHCAVIAFKPACHVAAAEPL